MSERWLRDYIQLVYRAQERIEESVGLIFSPGAVIGEGIATSACEMIFSPQELEQWLTEHIYPELGIEPQGEDTTKLQQAFDLLDHAHPDWWSCRGHNSLRPCAASQAE